MRASSHTGIQTRPQDGIVVRACGGRLGVMPVFILTATICGVLALPALAAQHPPLGSFGSANQPTFGSARAVTVDQETGDVLVVDSLAGTISRFHADGTPADFSALGSNVISGAGPAEETPFSFGSAFEEEVAVDSSGGVASGDIYVAQPQNPVKAVDVFAETGQYLGQLTAAGGQEFSEPCGVTVDGSGHVFVGNYGGQVYKFEPTLNPVANADNTATFETVARPCTLAAGAGPSAGSLFVATFEGSVTKISSETGEVDYGVVEGGDNPTSSVDLASGYLVVASGDTAKEFDVSGASGATLVDTITEQSEVEGVAVNGASGHVYVAASAGTGEERLGATGLLEYGPLTNFPPMIEGQQVLSGASAEASLEAQVNPAGQPTTVKVEYGLDSSYGKSTTPVSIGAGEVSRSVGVSLQGLGAGQLYHFRFSATNATGTSVGGDQTLRTSRLPAGEATCPNAALRTGSAVRLADCRAYEMVTPVDKNNTDIYGLEDLSNNLAETNQSAINGEALTYTTSQGFGDAEGTPYMSQYIASRTGDSWVNHSITPPQGTSRLNPGKRITLEFQDFSPDLCVSLLNHYTDPPLAPGAVEGLANIYRRTNCGALEYETVSTIQPVSVGTVPEPASIQGLSEDGRCALYFIVGLYETCDGETKQVNLLPDGTQAREGFVGTLGFAQGTQEFAFRLGDYQHAISADGSRVYWSPGPLEAPLYVRENAQAEPSALGSDGECLEPAKACTIPVSAESARTHFWGASPDGARAIYSVEPSNEAEKQELYEFDIETGASTLLASEVRGVMGVDEQASRVYFVSEESIQGQGTAGKPNLYLLDATVTGVGRYKFIATVSREDALFGIGEGKRLGMVQQWPIHRVARVSADGLHAVFSAYAPLTGYDNRDAVSGERDFEVFVYDALGDGGAGSLSCVSCNPTGQRPHGVDVNVEEEPFSNPNWSAGLVPPNKTAFHELRAMSEDGTRVFFDSYDALLPADTNGKEDVYEWEAPGSGPSGDRCMESSSSFSPANDGCLSLISSGESPSNSEFVDASPDGRDVFFKTAASLVSQDPGLIDIYDAREGGGFAPPPGQPSGCEGTACQNRVPASQALTPASSAFSGPGDVTTPSPSVVSSVKPKSLTRARKLAKALGVCKKARKKRKRVACEKRVRKQYGVRKAAKRSSKRRVGDDGRVK